MAVPARQGKGRSNAMGLGPQAGSSAKDREYARGHWDKFC